MIMMRERKRGDEE